MTTPKSIHPAQSVAAENTMIPEPPAQIDAIIQGAIGRKLRDVYDQIVAEQVPDELINVLKRLKQREAGGGTGSKG